MKCADVSYPSGAAQVLADEGIAALFTGLSTTASWPAAIVLLSMGGDGVKMSVSAKSRQVLAQPRKVVRNSVWNGAAALVYFYVIPTCGRMSLARMPRPTEIYFGSIAKISQHFGPGPEGMASCPSWGSCRIGSW